MRLSSRSASLVLALLGLQPLVFGQSTLKLKVKITGTASKSQASILGDYTKQVGIVNSSLGAIMDAQINDETAELVAPKTLDMSEATATSMLSLASAAVAGQATIQSFADASTALTRAEADFAQLQNPSKETIQQKLDAESAIQTERIKVYPLAKAEIAAQSSIDNYSKALAAPLSQLVAIKTSTTSSSPKTPASLGSASPLADRELVTVLAADLPALTIAQEHLVALTTALKPLSPQPGSPAQASAGDYANKLDSSIQPAPTWATILTGSSTSPQPASSTTPAPPKPPPAPPVPPKDTSFSALTKSLGQLYTAGQTPQQLLQLLQRSNAFIGQENVKLSKFVEMLGSATDLGDPTIVAQVSVQTNLAASDVSLFNTLVSGWTLFVGVLNVGSLTAPNLALVQPALTVGDAINQANINYQIVQANLTIASQPRYEEFTAVTVPLYYYRDVQRLVEIVRPDAQTVSNGQQIDLTSFRTGISDQSFQLENAQASLNDAQNRYRQALADEQSANTVVGHLTSLLNAATARVSRSNVVQANLQGQGNLATDNVQAAQTALTQAQSALTANTDPTKAAQLQSTVTKATQRVNAATRQATERQTAVSVEQAKAANLESQQQALQTQQTAAQDQLTQAQTAAASAMTDMENYAVAAAGARQTSADTVIQDQAAFVKNRDNQPLIYAAGSLTAGTPAGRVTLGAFKDQATVFLYGSREDVAMVQNIIAGYDRPAPQAKLTLWQLQMDVMQTPAVRKAANGSMARIRDLLSQLRSTTDAFGSLFRECVSTQVAVAVKRTDASTPTWLKQARVLTNDYESIKLLERFSFYKNSTLEGLGFHEGRAMSLESLQFSMRNIPDPAKDSTLGETLLIFSLATPENQREIVANLETAADNLLKKWESEQRWYSKDKPSMSFEKGFEKSLREFWIDDKAQQCINNQYKAAGGLSPFQAELLSALQRNIVINMVDEMHLKQVALKANAKLNATQKKALQAQLDVRYDFLKENFQLDRASLPDIFSDNRQFELFELQFPITTINARVAAADDLLKKMIEAVEDDVDDTLIEPTINHIHDMLDEAHLNVGILQRTSVLSTNRLVSRVDAGASAQLAASGTTDYLAAGQQLFQMVRSLATTPGAALGALTGSLKSPTEPQQELYGLTTGGYFQITPVFDPSGQALRFSFDFVNATRVRDPNGSTSAQLPRIERHTVDTEAQLSTFELRELSEFESNAQLGSPVRRWGGIPLLNYVPILRDIPIIGYFVRKGGYAAVDQEDVILGQTTIYPSIIDMVNLLTPLSNTVPVGGG